MDLIAESLAAMGTVQTLLATVFLASYGLALGRFVTARGRLIASLAAIVSAGGFAALSRPWEAGLVLIAFVPLAMALLAAAAWTLWHAATWRARPAARVETPSSRASWQAGSHARLARRLRAVHASFAARRRTRSQG